MQLWVMGLVRPCRGRHGALALPGCRQLLAAAPNGPAPANGSAACEWRLFTAGCAPGGAAAATARGRTLYDGGLFVRADSQQRAGPPQKAGARQISSGSADSGSGGDAAGAPARPQVRWGLPRRSHAFAPSTRRAARQRCAAAPGCRRTGGGWAPIERVPCAMQFLSAMGVAGWGQACARSGVRGQPPQALGRPWAAGCLPKREKRQQAPRRVKDVET
jgi:hypothetical protein